MNQPYRIPETIDDTSTEPPRTASRPLFRGGCGCISLILVITMLVSITWFVLDNDDNTGRETNNTSGEILYVTHEWDFKGNSWKYTTEINESDYDYFANKSRANDYKEYVLNPDDDDWMGNLADLFIEEADNKGWDESYYIPFALTFVQSIPYETDKVTTGYDDWPRYPVETIVEEWGDCEDTSILFASIVREMGYGVALLLLEEDKHMAVGVNISQSLIWSGGYSLTYYTASDGKKYYYCETTTEGWGIGQMPDDLIGTAKIIDVF